MIIVSKQQLADAYGRNAAAFFREIHANADLMERLYAAGYRKAQHSLTPKQLDIIYSEYGKPEE